MLGQPILFLVTGLLLLFQSPERIIGIIEGQLCLPISKDGDRSEEGRCAVNSVPVSAVTGAVIQSVAVGTTVEDCYAPYWCDGCSSWMSLSILFEHSETLGLQSPCE